MNPRFDLHPAPVAGPPQGPHLRFLAAQSKSWFGKLIAAVIGVMVMLLTLFLSIFVFAVLGSLLVVAVIYVLWTARRARREAQSQIIDNEAQQPPQR